MQYLNRTSGLSAVIISFFIFGCLDQFPEYAAPENIPADMVVQDAGPQADQGRMCSTSQEIVIGMPCILAGGEACGVGVCVSGEGGGVPGCGAESEDGRPITAPRETCNGLDDDCDGRVDEVFEQLGDTCMMEGLVGGQPASGEWICNPSHTGPPESDAYVCDCCLESEPDCDRLCGPICVSTGDEFCNDVDDDCDGVVDEDLESPCNYQLEGCSVMGKESCVSGLMTACAPPAGLPLNCRCIDAAFGGGTHYIHCPDLVSWTAGEAVCAQVRSGTTVGGVSFPSGRILEIESKVEQLFLNTALHGAGGGVKTWLNYGYDPSRDPNDFDDWLAQYFPTGTYHAVIDDGFEDDVVRCMSMENEPPYEWGFDPCTDVTSGFTCEFCADENLDNDGDGRAACAQDCDDTDPNVYWGALELCHNGKDDNCDGEVDEGCPCDLRVYGGHQYVFCHDGNEAESLNWDDAHTQCRDWGMTLLVLDTDPEFEQVAEMAKQVLDNTLWWIGVRQPNRSEDDEGDDVDRTRVWRWVETGRQDDPTSLWWQDDDRNRHDRADRDCGRFFARAPTTRHIRPDQCGNAEAYICESLP